jgi:hypothetical protein
MFHPAMDLAKSKSKTKMISVFRVGYGINESVF